ncbi:OsmC family protein [Caulobacter sp.]|uniref:OsmC family protein n=1 Tax=Caulobacter sp. TaxID=78 RepID=UPI001620B08D
MARETLADALARAAAVLQKRPGAGLHDDAPGLARWRGGVGVETAHPNGAQVLTDMPRELGGTGEQVTPGWMVRAGLAACTATTIAMIAAQDGLVLESLEVRADSRTDSRGLLGLAEVDGALVYPGPLDLAITVRITAPDIPPERLRALVETAQRRAPMSAALRDAQALPVRIVVD